MDRDELIGIVVGVAGAALLLLVGGWAVGWLADLVGGVLILYVVGVPLYAVLVALMLYFDLTKGPPPDCPRR